MIDKFTWLRAVYADTRFTDGQKAVLAFIATFCVLTGRDTFCIRQSTLADPEHCGISRQTVGGAIRQAKHLKYLAMAREHTRGRTHRHADTLRLLLPAKSKESLHHSAGSGETAEWCKENSPNGVKQTAEWCKAANAPTSENSTPYSSLNSSEEQAQAQPPAHGAASAARPAPIPQTNPSQKQKPAPNGASLDDDKRDRPQLGPAIHGLLKKANPAQAGNTNGLSPRAQAAIDAARANLDRAEQQNRPEEEQP